jgi:hypothetical protein
LALITFSLAGFGAAAATPGGPGFTDPKACDVPYGDPPAAESNILSSGDGSALVETVLGGLLDQCGLIGGKTLNWIDRIGEARAACLIVPPSATPATKLPLVVFLQGSLFPAVPQLIDNDWILQTDKADLNGNPSLPGFILLLPIGRNTHHFYPFPDEYALGWDNWYRNLDRSSPTLNLDVAAIDAFIAQVEARDIVDTNRVYLTGWSNGAAMAQLYALNTPGVAAAAVYSSPDPFTDSKDPCWQTPFANTMTPLMDIHNSCDIIGICQTGTQFHKDLAALYPKLPQDPVIVDVLKLQTSSCNALCASQVIENPGAANHVIWPYPWNQPMFTWLREHPLSSKPK